MVRRKLLEKENDEMRALVLSGGASKGAFTAGVVKYLLREREMKFDIAVGTSTGSLVAGPALLGDYNYLSNVYTSVHNSDIYKNSLVYWLLNQVKKLGPIDASMEPLYRTVRRYYLTKGNLEELTKAKKQFVVTIVNVRTGKVAYVSTKQLNAKGAKKISPETFVKAIVASCSEPVFTEPIRVFESEAKSPEKDDLFYDGGVREFLPFERAVKLGAKEIWAVSTHPLRIEETPWGNATSPDKVSLIKALGWTIGALTNEVERGDLFRAWVYYRLGWAEGEIKKTAADLGLSSNAKKRFLKILDQMFSGRPALPKLYVISPSEPMPTSLEFDPAIMEDYLADGELAAEKFFKQGQPEFVDSGGWLLSKP
jgi:predicted acylesterase/phospholipase RssA